MIRNLFLAVLAVTASVASAQFGATGPNDAAFWIGGVSLLPTSGDATQWKNRWNGYVSNAAVQAGISLSGIQQAIDSLAAAHGTAQFGVVKTRVAADLAALATKVKNSENRLKIALYTQLLKFQ